MMNRRTLLSRIGMLAGTVLAVPLLRLFPKAQAATSARRIVTAEYLPCSDIHFIAGSIYDGKARVTCFNERGKPATKACGWQPPVYYGDGEHDDTLALKAWEAKEVICWPDGTIVQATHWNSPYRATA